MSSQLTEEELAALMPSEFVQHQTPIPTQIVSSDEFVPMPQTAKQREVEARLKALADELARRQGMTRRQFFRTAAGMAAAFVAMNQVYGPLFEVSPRRGRDAGAGGRACRRAGRAVHLRWPHALPARRHAAR